MVLILIAAVNSVKILCRKEKNCRRYIKKRPMFIKALDVFGIIKSDQISYFLGAQLRGAGAFLIGLRSFN